MLSNDDLLGATSSAAQCRWRQQWSGGGGRCACIRRHVLAVWVGWALWSKLRSLESRAAVTVTVTVTVRTSSHDGSNGTRFVNGNSQIAYCCLPVERSGGVYRVSRINKKATDEQGRKTGSLARSLANPTLLASHAQNPTTDSALLSARPLVLAQGPKGVTGRSPAA